MNQPNPTEPSKPPVRRRGGLVRKLVLLFLTCCLCLLALEWGVRRAFPFYRPSSQIARGMFVNGVALGVPLQSVRQATPKGDWDIVIRFNEDGLRDDKNLREATEADWFAVGDSFTMGYGVEINERFSNRLQEAFATHGIQARVFNVAVPENIIGYQRLLAYAESRGAKVRHMVVGLCMENDLCDYRSGKTALETDAQALHDSARRFSKGSIRTWFQEHSAVYLACSYALQKFSLARRLFEKLGIARGVQEMANKNEWNETVLKTSRDELLKLIAGRDALVLIIPSRRLWIWDNQETERKVHDSFVSLLREAGVSVVDVRPALEAQGNPLACHFKTDPHWNPRGHEIAARELFKAIQARRPAAEHLVGK